MRLLKILIPLFIFATFFLSLLSVQIGGDDSKLYYYFPNEYIENFSTKIISDNQAGSLGIYFSQTYVFASVQIISLISSAIPSEFILPTMLLANSALSFLFFFKISEKIKIESSYVIKIAGSLLYAFSIFTYYSVWSHQLFSVYLTSFLPISIYYLLSFLETKEWQNIAKILLISVVYSFVFYSIPWILGTLIALSPYLLLLFLKYRSLLIKASIVIICFILLLNIHWLFHFLYAPFSSGQKSDIISQASSQNINAANVNNIELISKNNSVIYPLTNLFQKSIQVDFGWKSYGIYKEYYEKNLLVNFLFITIIALAFLLQKNNYQSKIYLTSLFSWLITLYFYSVKIGGWGLPLFIELNNRIFGFGMFRNMYDKFSIGMAITSALLFYISSSLVYSSTKATNLKKVFLLTIFFISLINSYPFITGKLFKQSFGTNGELYNRLSKTKEQVLTFIQGFENLENEQRIIWWPLNTANYTIIDDNYVSNQFYAGVSPLSLLSKHRDLNGLLSLNDIQRKAFLDSLEQKNYQEIGRLMQTLNISHVALYDFDNEKIKNSYLFTTNTWGDFYNKQINPDLLKEILGNEVKKIPGSYSIYEINEKYKSNKIYLSDNSESFSIGNELSYTKIDSHIYKLKINKLEANSELVFLEPYHDGWQLFYEDDLKNPLLSGKHEFIFNYANGWKIDPNLIDQNKTIILYFKPYDYFVPMIAVSLVTLCLIATFLIIKTVKRK